MRTVVSIDNISKVEFISLRISFLLRITLISAFDNIDSDTSRASRSDIAIYTWFRQVGATARWPNQPLIDSWINTLESVRLGSFAYNRPSHFELLSFRSIVTLSLSLFLPPSLATFLPTKIFETNRFRPAIIEFRYNTIRVSNVV